MAFSLLHGLSIQTTILTIFLTSLLTSAINPGCRCLRFVNTVGKEWGVFSSPDYPLTYPRGIDCLLYSFHAPKYYIVEIFLQEFNLPEAKSHSRCLSGDYLKIFVHLEDGAVNELTPWDSVHCGSKRNVTFYSSTTHFIMQFHSTIQKADGNSQSSYGFTGLFRFINASQYASNGRLVPGTKCDFQFQSGNTTVTDEKFFSPNFPSTYPNNIKCSYFFHASLHERVIVNFEHVDLQPIESSCLNKTDMIRVLDGLSLNSPVISIICNNAKEIEVLSTGPNLLVEFIANSEYPRTGFKGSFQFVKIKFNNLEETTVSHLQINSKDSVGTGRDDGLTQASTLVPQCNQVLRSEGGRNGTFTSPNYPHYYPTNTRCTFQFIGHGKERVQILFTNFQLFHSQKHTKSCVGDSSLSVFIQLGGSKIEVGGFCETDDPLPFMSNTHRLYLEFNGNKASRITKGFSATYNFREDYGMNGDKQLKDFPCGFVYNSTNSSNGTISSPNFPGNYPGDTECHYFFYGMDNQHIHLQFQQFEIHGKKPCDESTKSDYVEFSNFMHVDDSFERTCGNKDPFRIQSEGKFFRFTFRSNSINGSQGFSATYDFCDISEHKQKRQMLSSIAPKMSCSIILKVYVHSLHILIHLVLSYFLSLK